MVIQKLLFVLLLLPLSLIAKAIDENATDGTLLNQPSALIDIAPRYHYALIVELELGKLHVFKRNSSSYFDLIKSMDVSIGKEGIGKEIEGDNKTPIGVYRIISHLTNLQLDDFYGHAAYPINYPNAWDRIHNRTGHGIWLHAEPVGTFGKNRPYLDSNGCVVMSNNDIDELAQYLDVGYTYFVSTPKMKLTSADKNKGLREKIYGRMHEWEMAWESKDNNTYLSLYSKNFNNLTHDWASWVNYKKRVNDSKKFIKIGFSDVGIYAYPGEEGLYWIEFYQSYKSSNFESRGWKRQLWKQDPDGELRIIYEGGG